MYKLLILTTLLPAAGYGIYKAFKAVAAPSALINPFKDELKRHIFDFALKAQLPPALMFAIIKQESAFDQYALRLEPSFFQRRVKINPTYENAVLNYGWNETNFGSYGLGQLLLSTAWDLGWRGAINDLYDINTNLNYMAMLLHRLIKRFSDTGEFTKDVLMNVITAYNSGRGVEGAPSITLNDYLPRVLKNYQYFLNLINEAQGVV